MPGRKMLSLLGSAGKERERVFCATGENRRSQKKKPPHKKTNVGGVWIFLTERTHGIFDIPNSSKTPGLSDDENGPGKTPRKKKKAILIRSRRKPFLSFKKGNDASGRKRKTRGARRGREARVTRNLKNDTQERANWAGKGLCLHPASSGSGER